MHRIKLAILLSHPIQYQSPLLQKLAAAIENNVEVIYCSQDGLEKGADPGFGVRYEWDRPLLEGYAYRILKNHSPRPSVNRFWGLVNLGILPYLVAQRPSALLIHGYASCTSILAYTMCLILNIPIFFRGETILKNDSTAKTLFKTMFLKSFFLGVTAILYIGTKSKEFYRLYGVPDGKLFFTPYAVDNDFFISQRNDSLRKEEQKKLLDLPDLPCILYVGKLTDRKRPLDLLAAFARLTPDSASLIFVGDGELRKTLEKKIERENIKNVFITGFKNQTELPAYYRAADIFVFPSGFEPFGLVLNEALCFSLPVIVTREVASSADLVRDNGFVYDAGDVDSLALHLRTLLQHPAMREQMGRASLRMIQPWSNDVCCASILAALHAAQPSTPQPAEPMDC